MKIIFLLLSFFYCQILLTQSNRNIIYEQLLDFFPPKLINELSFYNASSIDTIINREKVDFCGTHNMRILVSDENGREHKISIKNDLPVEYSFGDKYSEIEYIGGFALNMINHKKDTLKINRDSNNFISGIEIMNSGTIILIAKILNTDFGTTENWYQSLEAEPIYSFKKKYVTVNDFRIVENYDEDDTLSQVFFGGKLIYSLSRRKIAIENLESSFIFKNDILIETHNLLNTRILPNLIVASFLESKPSDRNLFYLDINDSGARITKGSKIRYFYKDCTKIKESLFMDNKEYIFYNLKY